MNFSHAQSKVRGFLVQEGEGMDNKKISGKTHTKEQLDNWANQNNPNNKAYRANAKNHSNQMNPNHKSHQAVHNSRRRHKEQLWPDWAPDYIEYDD